MDSTQANLNLIANTLGKENADKLYKLPGGQSFYDTYGGDRTGETQAELAAGTEGSNPQYNQSTVQPSTEFSGYGQPTPSYGTEDRHWAIGHGEQNSSDYEKRLPKANGIPITNVRQNGKGNIVGFKLKSGQVLDYTQMLEIGLKGGFEGLRIQTNQVGDLVIRAVPDGYTDNNLDNLPRF
jgi:hypothetical protein